MNRPPVIQPKEGSQCCSECSGVNEELNEPMHELKTIEDILKVVNEDNVDNFLKDFSTWIKVQIATKKVNEAIGGGLTMNPVLKWIDDGKNDITAKVTIEPPTKRTK